MLEPEIPSISDDVIAAIRERVPAYRRPLRGRFGAGIRVGVEEALRVFVQLLSDPDLDRSGSDRVYRALGAGEFRERRSLDALLAAYRLGARVSWHRVAALAIDAGVDRRTLALLAEAIFAYIDEISAISAEGYAEAQLAAAGAAERVRRRLAIALLSSDPDPDAIEAAAADAGWRLPATLAALAWDPGAAGIRTRLPADALVAEEDEDGGGLAVIPDPDAPGLRARLARAAGGGLAVLGPTVPPPEAAASAARARELRRLAEAGVVEARGLELADDHLAALVAHGDEPALRDLAARRLAPLAGETPASRERLEATLRAWLDHQGEVGRVAAELHVHPQTVRYRLGRLRELFGDALESPSARFELALALRASGFAGAGRGKSAPNQGGR